MHDKGGEVGWTARLEEIQALVSGFGYSSSGLQAGCELAERAQAAVQAQKLAAGAQKDATQALADAKTAATDAYQALAKVARAICNSSQLTALGLSGKMPNDTAGFLIAAYTLFDKAGLSEFVLSDRVDR